MTTAIYLGNKVIMKILEEKEFEKGKNPVHIEAAILSYRNKIVKEIIEIINEINESQEKDKIINKFIITASKNNNIKGVELFIQKGWNINTKDKF